MFKKIFSVLLVCALSVFACFALTACGASNEELLEQAITEEFDKYKNMDDEVLSSITELAENQQMSEYGIDTTEYATLVLDGFEYNIDSITVDGKNATVEMSIASKSASALYEGLQAALDDLKNNSDVLALDKDDRVKVVGDTVVQVFKDVPVVNETCTINYTLVDNTWTPTNSAQALGSLDSVVFSQTVPE